MKHTTLENIIKTYIPLPEHTNSGWHSILCKVCNDHGRKGLRAGFRFEDESVSYNCFNCGHTASFNPHSDKKLSKKMITVLKSFGVPEDAYKIIDFQQLGKHSSNNTSHSSVIDKLEPTEIPLPDHFYRLTYDENDKWSIIAWNYLKGRGVDPTSYTFYLSTGKTKNKSEFEQTRVKQWIGRVIIPIYKDKKLIFYQGRSLTNNTIKKYLSADVPRNNILYGYNLISEEKTNTPIYVVEGWFDAFAINGVAVLGNKMTMEQITWLKKTSKQKIIVPDRYGNGHFLATQGLKLGWSVSFPDVSSSCKDVSDAVCKYGKLYTLKSIADNTFSGLDAQVRIKQLLKK